MVHYWTVHRLRTFSMEYKIAKNTVQRMVLNLVGNTVTRDAIESDTPYDVTDSRPRKTTRAFLAIFQII